MEEHFYGEKDNDSELSSDDGKDEGNYTFCFVFFFGILVCGVKYALI